jgi:quinol monooxygenase YgiN
MKRGMINIGLLVTMEAKAGREEEVESFLRSGLQLVDEEPGTTTWFAFRIGTSSFGIFDTFPDEGSRDAHLNGKVAAALIEKAEDLLTGPPTIAQTNILAAKLPALAGSESPSS